MTVVDGNESYFIITLSNVSDGSALGNKDYWGWCFEKAVSMTREQIHPVRLCHSFDPDMPEAFKHANWTLINFIINRDDLYPTEDIQEAIWAILEGNTTVSLGAQTVIADATTQGSSYLPGNGDYLAVLAYLDPESEQGYPYSVQNTFLQVPLTYTACPLPYWRDTLDFWPAPFAPDDLVGVYVDLPSYFDSIERFTLQEILEGSSSSHPLFSIYTHAIQQAIVALLNAHHTDISYPITYDQIIISLHDALPSPAKTVLLTIILNGYNHIGCDCMDSGLTCPCCS